MDCPKHNCEKIRCACHISTKNVYDIPVHDSCDWYKLYYNRKKKLKKLYENSNISTSIKKR